MMQFFCDNNELFHDGAPYHIEFAEQINGLVST